MPQEITIVLYSYKSKNLKNVVSTIVKNSTLPFVIHVIDQNPLIRKDMFKEYDFVRYRHVDWNDQMGEAYYRDLAIKKASGDYVLIISDDILLQPNWDLDLINFVNNKNLLVSGSGISKVFHKDKFFLSIASQHSDNFSLSNYIDRNFIFFSKKTLLSKTDLKTQELYPTNVKYYGQEEILSLNLFCRGIEIYSSPSSTYIDLKTRNLENLYSPFSIEHNYNIFVDLIKNATDEVFLNNTNSVLSFLNFHSINLDKIHKIPFQNNDVGYNIEYATKVGFKKSENDYAIDPSTEAWDDGRRYIGTVTGI
jgi:glycosyltransferase involved in cell wall biosynthesis